MKDFLTRHENASEIWPIPERKTPRMSDQVRSMRAHQLAHLLLSIRDDLLHVSSLSKEKSWALQEYAATRFAKDYLRLLQHTLPQSRVEKEAR